MLSRISVWWGRQKPTQLTVNNAKNDQHNAVKTSRTQLRESSEGSLMRRPLSCLGKEQRSSLGEEGGGAFPWGLGRQPRRGNRAEGLASWDGKGASMGDAPGRRMVFFSGMVMG